MLDQIKATITNISLKRKGIIEVKIAITKAAILIGNMQYPKTHTLYKNDT